MSKAPKLAATMTAPTNRLASEIALQRLRAWAASAANEGSRLAWVDVAKGFCIILVVMMHSTLGLGEAVGREGWLHTAVEFARPFRIPAFFLIAGLFLSRTIDESWARFLDRKVLHFVYFYLLWTAIQCGVKFLPTEGAAGFANHFLKALVEPFGTLWFIYLLPIFFIVTKLARRAPAWIVLAEAVAMNLWPHETGFTAIDEFMSRYIFFFAGYLFAPRIFAFAEAARANRDVIIPAIGAVFALIAAAAFTAGFGGFASMARTPGIALALGALGAGALIATAVLIANTAAGRVIRTCGERSIIIYLAFFLPMAITRIALIKTGAVNLIGVGAASAIVTLVAIVTPLILYRFIGKGPLGWLFERPQWARFSEAKPAPAQLRAA